MNLPKLPKDHYDGRYVVEVVDEFGCLSVGAWSKESVDAIGKPGPAKCGECCHPEGHEPREAISVIGVVRGGKVYGEHADGVPIQKWFHNVRRD